jgi:hypothetical protein
MSARALHAEVAIELSLDDLQATADQVRTGVAVGPV